MFKILSYSTFDKLIEQNKQLQEENKQLKAKLKP